jgi:selenide,water dikinase
MTKYNKSGGIMSKIKCSGGCGAKLSPKRLSQILNGLDIPTDESILVSSKTKDDCAVKQINDTTLMVQTLDFFTPMFEDLYIFGQVAAANALSDIYAMGGYPQIALSILSVEYEMDDEQVKEVLEGAISKLKEAGCSLAGGHTIATSELLYGLSVTGMIQKDDLLVNNNTHLNDAIILTKKIGVGTLVGKNNAVGLKENEYNELVNQITTLNKNTLEVAKQYNLHAATDVTGFGLIGHLSEMVNNNTIEVNTNVINFLTGSYDAIKEDYITGGATRNRDSFQEDVLNNNIDPIIYELLYDPQTNGGLLMSLKQEEAVKLVEDLNRNNIPASIIGKVIEEQDKKIVLN